MRKLFKKAIVALVFLLIVSISVSQASAVVNYQLNGFTFNLLNNTTATISDYDDRSPEMVVPSTLLEKKIVSISNEAFRGDTQITSVDFSQAVYLNKIGMYAFDGCSSISEGITLPESLTEIMYCAFQNCSSLPSVVLNGKLKTVPKWCFLGCTSLRSVTLNNGLETIEAAAFSGCISLEYLEVPQSVTSIDSNAFANCDDLILGVYTDSYALQYAEENQIDHIILDGDKLGDVNGDGVVDILDATEIQKYAAESTDFTDEQFELGDINKDGYCDVIDALLVQKSVIGAYEIPQNIIRY